VLRTSERARSIHRLARVRDESSNDIAVVSASKALIADQPIGGHAATSGAVPGLVIVIGSDAVPVSSQDRHDEANPLIDITPVRDDG